MWKSISWNWRKKLGPWKRFDRMYSALRYVLLCCTIMFISRSCLFTDILKRHKWTENGTKTQHCVTNLRQVWANAEHQVAHATTFYTVLPKISCSTIWNLPRFVIVSRKILCWLLDCMWILYKPYLKGVLRLQEFIGNLSPTSLTSKFE